MKVKAGFAALPTLIGIQVPAISIPSHWLIKHQLGIHFQQKLLKEQQNKTPIEDAKKIPLGMKQPDSDTFLFSEKIV